LKNKSCILITGANGQTGREFRSLEAAYPQYDFLFAGREELPVEDAAAVSQYFSQHDIDFCVNCAAYTAVDKAESEPAKAFSINRDAVGILAGACAQYKVQLIHISTDYVFDGTATEPIREDHTTNPLGIYGESKLQGEVLCVATDPTALIIRTSWVYSAFGNNFVKTMLRLMKEKESINVVNDQWGAPTYAADLAKAILEIIGQNDIAGKHPGSNIYHYSNAGLISWYDFAVSIKELTGSNCVVNPIPSSQYPTPVTRPHYSLLDTTKIRSTFGIEIPSWKDSLVECLDKLSEL